MFYFYVSFGYSIINVLLASIILIRSRKNVLAQFYVFCVLMLVGLGVTGYFVSHQTEGIALRALGSTTAFLFSLFPFFFIHFMLIFVRRYEILNSKAVLFMNYFAGMFSYGLLLLGFIPVPFTPQGVTPHGHIFYITWMSILFTVGVALLYSSINGFKEKGVRSNLLFVGFAILMLLLPTPFTLSILTTFFENSSSLFFITSTLGLTVVVYLVFRHRISMNTPYQAMRSALGAMNDILLKTDEKFEIEMVQGGAVAALGYTELELTGRSLEEFLAESKSLRRFAKKVFEENAKEGFFDVDVIRKDGSHLPMEFSFTPVLANEEIIGFVGVARNISERKAAEKALLESEARYRSLFESNPSPLMVYDAQSFEFLVVNDAAVRTYGYSRQDFGRMNICDILPLADDTSLVNRLAQAGLKMQTSGYWRHRKKDGSVIDVDLTSIQLSFEGRDAWLVLINDVTERKKAEETIKASEEKYRKFFMEDITGDIIATPGGKLLSCNPAFAHIFGFKSVEAAMGTNTISLFPGRKSYDSFLKLLKEKKKLEYYELELQRVDGASVHVVQNVIGTFDDKGELKEIKSYIFDNTERKQLEDQFRQAQKMENLGTLAGGIAHDFNNTLTIILAYASLLERPGTGLDAIPSKVKMIKKAVDRAAGMVRQLLTFARKAEAVFEPVEINTSLQDLLSMLQSTFPKSITFDVQFDHSLTTTISDANQMHQAVLNLCVNARDAMTNGSDEPKGVITMQTKRVSGSEARSKFPDARAGEYAVIRVGDTGAGMDEKTKSKIFEPFFTTKETGKGTGLGLAVVYGVAQSHRGFVDVESHVGKGTTFSLYFPLPEEGLTTVVNETGRLEEVRRGHETILLVEDEELLLESMKTLLEDEGYTVLTAIDGEQAVQMYEGHQDEIDFVLTDLGLPKMSGWEAYENMKRINPAVKVMFGTGKFDHNFKYGSLKGGAVDFIQKPYLPNEVLKRIRDVIGVPQ